MIAAAPAHAQALHRALANLLVDFYEAGGWGDLDIHGRVIAGEPPGPLSGDPVSWMRLIAGGYVGGDNGQILITEEGREEALRLIAGRTHKGI